MASRRAASVGEGYIELEAVRRRTDDKIPFLKSEVMTIRHSYPVRCSNQIKGMHIFSITIKIESVSF